MKKRIYPLLMLCTAVVLFASCNVFKPKYGCGSNGKNVGAEKILSGEGPKKAKKFKA